MYTVEELKQECIKRYGADWKNVKIKAHADGISCGNDGGYTPDLENTLGNVWGINGLLHYNGNWAEPITETSELDQDIQSLRDKYLQYRFTITVEDNL